MSFATNIMLPLFFAFFSFVAIPQTEFTNFSKDNGLSSNNILVSMVDSKGAIWLGTGNGLSVYTSKGWVQITSISDNDRYNKYIGRVTKLFEASNGDIWVCAEKGIFLYNGSFWTYFDDDDDTGFHVVDQFEDSRGWIWVMLEKHQSLKDLSTLGFSIVEGSVQMYDGNTWHKFEGLVGGSAAIRLGLVRQYFTSYLVDRNDNIWITTKDGLFQFTGNEWKEFYDDEMLSKDCNDVIEDSSGNIWIATEEGVAVYNNEDEWVKYQKEKGIKGYEVVKLMEGLNDRVWAISRKDKFFKSLCYFDNGGVSSYKKEKLKLKGDIENIIVNGDLVIAFANRGVSLLYDNNWVCITSKYKTDDANYSNFSLIPDGVIFTGRKGLYKVQNEIFQTLYKNDDHWKVSCVKLIGDKIYIGTEKSGFYVYNFCRETQPCLSTTVNYNVTNGLPDDFVKDIIADKMNNVWIVTKAGISKFEGTH
jgi:ligand-binding sensor domain-containing protein